MATKSMLKSIIVKDSRAAKRLINAIERSNGHTFTAPVKRPNCARATERQIDNIFGSKK